VRPDTPQFSGRPKPSSHELTLPWFKIHTESKHRSVSIAKCLEVDEEFRERCSLRASPELAGLTVRVQRHLVSHTSDRNKSEPFSSRRPPPIDEDFEVIGSKRGASFEQARQAYKDAARKHHPDAGGDPEVMKRVNAAWDRVRRTYGR
jgi:hypothetical protein